MSEGDKFQGNVNEGGGNQAGGDIHNGDTVHHNTTNNIHHHHPQQDDGDGKGNRSITTVTVCVLLVICVVYLIVQSVMSHEKDTSELLAKPPAAVEESLVNPLVTTDKPHVKPPITKEEPFINPSMTSDGPTSPLCHLRLELASEFRTGDDFSFRVEVPEEGYLYVIAHWADQSHYLLFPTEVAPNNKVEANQVVYFPRDQGEPMKMHFPDNINSDVVREDISVILTHQPLPQIPINTQRDLKEHLIDAGLISKKSLAMSRGPKVTQRLTWQAPASVIATETQPYTLYR